MDMKVKRWMAKYASGMMAFMLAVIAGQIATAGCLYCYYQPKEPEGLMKFVRNK